MHNSEQSNHAMMRMMDEAQLLPAPAPAPAPRKQAVAGGSRATAIDFVMPSQAEMDAAQAESARQGTKDGKRPRAGEAWGAVRDRRSAQTLRVALPVGDARGLAALRLDAETRRRLVRMAREVEAMPSEWRSAIADEVALGRMRGSQQAAAEPFTLDPNNAASVEAHRWEVLSALKAARTRVAPLWLERLPQGVVRCASLHPYLDAWAAEDEAPMATKKKTRAGAARKDTRRSVAVALPRVEGLTTLRYSAEGRRQLILAKCEVGDMRPAWVEAIAAELPLEARDLDLTSAKSVGEHAAAVRSAVLVARATLAARHAGRVPWVECLPAGVLRCEALHADLDAWAHAWC